MLKIKHTIRVMFFILITFLMSSSAIALNLSCGSKEMMAGNSCDTAGNVTIYFTETDYNIIASHLDSYNTPMLNSQTGMPERTAGFYNYVMIRVYLGGRNIAPTAQPPVLCKEIAGNVDTNGASGIPLPKNGNLVSLDLLDTEVSDVTNNQHTGLAEAVPVTDNIPDISAYVYGEVGSQYLTIYITDISTSINWNIEGLRPWIKVGLYDEIVHYQGMDDSTAICSNVADFQAVSFLEVSLSTDPSSLNYVASNNQIGNFINSYMGLRGCTADEVQKTCYDTPVDEIKLSDLENLSPCQTFSHCSVAEGTFPPSGLLKFSFRSNGPFPGSHDQSGVYFRRVDAYTDNGFVLPQAWTYYEFDEISIVLDLDCTFKATFVKGYIDAAELLSYGGEQIQFCINFQIDPSNVNGQKNVNFWIGIEEEPEGQLLKDAVEGPRLIYPDSIPKKALPLIPLLLLDD